MLLTDLIVDAMTGAEVVGGERKARPPDEGGGTLRSSCDVEIAADCVHTAATPCAVLSCPLSPARPPALGLRLAGLSRPTPRAAA